MATAVRGASGRSGRRELVTVGVLYAAVLTATFVTYSRIPSRELYHVSHSGVVGGLSRSLLELNFPDALIAVPLALIAVDALRASWATVAAATAVVLCLVAVWPGVVDQSDFDARLVNAVPATGVVVTVLLATAAARRLPGRTPRLPGDPARLVIAVVLVIGAVPYLFAELGFYAPDPLLADEPTPGERIAAVHLGSHEGMDGTLLALGVLLLSRLTPQITRRRLAAVISTVMALFLAYGVANLIQDDWLEQVVKRGWTDHRIPSVVHPQLSLGWALIVLVGIATELFWFRRERGRPARPLRGSSGAG